jgi:hypothetical protein
VQAEYKGLPIRHHNQVYNIILDTTEKKDENVVYTVDIFSCGYFISPYENGALIVIGKTVEVFEGYDIEFIFTGCHLHYGFK